MVQALFLCRVVAGLLLVLCPGLELREAARCGLAEVR